MLGHSNVDLLVGGYSLSLILALQKPVLSSIHIAAVDIGNIFRVVLGIFLRLVSFLLNSISDTIKFIDFVFDDLFDGLLECWAHDLQHDRLEQGKQSLVPGLLERDIDVLDININMINLEEVL